jgi:lipoprotein-anchoring transpeptidase ErfK/SrfK
MMQSAQPMIIRMTVQRLVEGALLAAGRLPALAQSPSPSGSSFGQAKARSSRRIVVSLVDRYLVLLEANRVVKSYPVAVDTPTTPTPKGKFHVANRLLNPTYYRPGIVIPPGKANPLGTHWLGLSLKGYGIHGTSDPSSIGQAVSSACIRMRNADVQELFELVPPNGEVEIYAACPAALATVLRYGCDGAEPFSDGKAPAAFAAPALSH